MESYLQSSLYFGDLFTLSYCFSQEELFLVSSGSTTELRIIVKCLGGFETHNLITSQPRFTTTSGFWSGGGQGPGT